MAKQDLGQSVFMGVSEQMEVVLDVEGGGLGVFEIVDIFFLSYNISNMQGSFEGVAKLIGNLVCREAEILVAIGGNELFKIGEFITGLGGLGIIPLILPLFYFFFLLVVEGVGLGRLLPVPVRLEVLRTGEHGFFCGILYYQIIISYYIANQNITEL